MFCTKCGVELRDEDKFCSKCGCRVRGAEGPEPVVERRLMLDKRNKKIAGVCAGFARYLDIDVTLVRVIWLIMAFGTGIGFIAYPIAWIVIPAEPWRPETVPVQQQQAAV